MATFRCDHFFYQYEFRVSVFLFRSSLPVPKRNWGWKDQALKANNEIHRPFLQLPNVFELKSSLSAISSRPTWVIMGRFWVVFFLVVF